MTLFSRCFLPFYLDEVYRLNGTIVAVLKIIESDFPLHFCWLVDSCFRNQSADLDTACFLFIFTTIYSDLTV